MHKLKQIFSFGVRHLREYPQVLHTATVAVIVVGLFSYVVWSFSSLAQRAYERTAEVRIGALLDGIALAAQWGADDPQALEEELARIMLQNETLAAMEVWRRNPTNSNAPHYFERVAAVAREGFPLSVWDRSESIVAFALGDGRRQTYLRLDEFGGERLYLAARAFPQGDGYVRAVLYISQADVAISRQIFESYALTFVLVLVVILLLFRVARITDYALLYERLREADALKDRFFSLASHELRAPITVVQGYLSLLAERLRSEDERSLAEKAARASDMLLQLVNDLLDVSRLSEGRLSFSITCTQAFCVCNDVVEAFRQLAENKRLSFSFVCAKDIWVRVDTDRLRQVLNNLVSNAIKYTLQGSVALRVNLSEDGKWVVVEVEDTGLGMSSEEQQHLFERFYRSARESVRREAGTGLGMWITRELVTRMDGTIAVESIEGRGTKVQVRLPACQPSSREEG